MLLGSTKNGGVPLELFAAGESRWLQVKFYAPGEVDPPRVLLVSVPYALKAGDADTLGGKPASAYLLAGPAASNLAQSSQPANATPALVSGTVAPSATTPDYIPRFTSTSGALGNSAIYQNGSDIGIGTKKPAATLEVNGSAQVDGGSILASGGAPVIQFPNNGSNNFSAGLGALSPTTTGHDDTAVGGTALQVNTTGFDNTATGYQALALNTTGNGNTAIGASALAANTTVSNNTAVGSLALQSNTGCCNTAIGQTALQVNTSGYSNEAVGNGAMVHNTTGSNNVAIGNASLYFNTTGSNNIAIGTDLAGGQNITTTSNNIEIGNNGTATDSGVIRIGTIGTQTSSTSRASLG